MQEHPEPLAPVVPLSDARRWAPEAIVEGLRRRDPAAAGALFDRVGERVNRLVWRLLGADPDHDDVVHQAFVNGLGSLRTLKDPEALDSWMVGVTVNTVRRELRARTYRRRVEAQVEPPEVPDERANPQRMLATRRLFLALRKVKPKWRIAFCLRMIEGFSIAEVAAASGCSIATAKRWIATAKGELLQQARLDPILADYIIDGDDHDG